MCSADLPAQAAAGRTRYPTRRSNTVLYQIKLRIILHMTLASCGAALRPARAGGGPPRLPTARRHQLCTTTGPPPGPPPAAAGWRSGKKSRFSSATPRFPPPIPTLSQCILYTLLLYYSIYNHYMALLCGAIDGTTSSMRGCYRSSRTLTSKQPHFDIVAAIRYRSSGSLQGLEATSRP